MRPRLRRLALVGVAALALAACGAGGGQGGHAPPRDGQAGLQLSGTFAGRQLAVSDGAPNLFVDGACARRIGVAVDLCFASRDIDGSAVVVSFLNADVLEPGTALTVGAGDCRAVQECARVTDVAVVEVHVGGRRQRATSGRVDVRALDAGARYAGSTTLGFRDGRLAGTFDVVPRPDL